jgi:6-phosphogluconate dehydrogenase (decarboxylating)
MELGMIGLGRMGGNMTERLVRGGHKVVGFDPNPDAVRRVVATGGTGANSLAALVRQLSAPRAVWTKPSPNSAPIFPPGTSSLMAGIRITKMACAAPLN